MQVGIIYQGLGLLTTDVDNARHPENPRGYSCDPPQGPADGRLVGLVQTGHKVLGDSASVQDQKNKKVILNSPTPHGRPERFFGASIRSRQ